MPTPNGSTAAYLRISLDAKGDAVSTDRQAKRAAQIARKHGLPAPVAYTEPGSTSASKPRGKKSAYAKLLADVRAGRVQVVIVWDLDRLTRQPDEMEEWLKLCEQFEVRIITMDGEVDTTSPNGRLFLRIKADVSRHEIEHKAARQRDANLGRVEAGVPWLSGARPLGYTEGRTAIVKGEAEAVRQAYQDVLGGASLRTLRRRWEAAGIANPSTGVARWPAATFRDVLTRPTYAGLRIYRGVEYPVKVPVIVEPDLWRAVQLVLADPARRTTDVAGRPIRSLLPTIATCGRCGHALTSGSALDNRTREYYRTLRCHRTPHLSRKAGPIEAYVVEVVLARLRRKDAAKLFRAEAVDLEPLRRRAGDLRSQREALAADLDVDLAFATARDRRLRDELHKVEAEVAAKSSASALGAFASGREPGEVWAGLDLDARRAVVRELVEVEVLPLGRGRGHGPFDPATVRVTPRRR